MIVNCDIHLGGKLLSCSSCHCPFPSFPLTTLCDGEKQMTFCPHHLLAWSLKQQGEIIGFSYNATPHAIELEPCSVCGTTENIVLCINDTKKHFCPQHLYEEIRSTVYAR